MITTVDGDEKGLVDDSGFNTRYRDTGADKKRGVPKGSPTNKVLVLVIPQTTDKTCKPNEFNYFTDTWKMWLD